MNHLEIKLRDALSEICDIVEGFIEDADRATIAGRLDSFTTQPGREALALTADASEDAPDSMDELRKRLGDPLAICYQGMNFNVYRAEDVARVLARPAPVRKGDGND